MAGRLYEDSRRHLVWMSLLVGGAAQAGSSLHMPAPKECLTAPEDVELKGDEALAAAEGLTPQGIRGGVEAFLPQVSRCVRGTAPADVAWFEVRVGCDGRVMSVDPGEHGDWSPELLACVTDTLRYAAFPAHALPEGDVFTQPITFSDKAIGPGPEDAGPSREEFEPAYVTRADWADEGRDLLEDAPVVADVGPQRDHDAAREAPAAEWKSSAPVITSLIAAPEAEDVSWDEMTDAIADAQESQEEEAEREASAARHAAVRMLQDRAELEGLAATEDSASASMPEPEVVGEPAVPEVEPEPEPVVVEEEPEPEPVVAPEPVVVEEEPDPEPEPEVAPEPVVVEVAPEPLLVEEEPEPAVEAEPVVVEVEPEVETEPVVPDPVVVPEPEVEAEPVAVEVEPEPVVVEVEPEPVVVEPEVAPEPVVVEVEPVLVEVEPVAEEEPEPVVMLEPAAVEVEPEPVVAREPAVAPDPEPVIEPFVAEVEPEPDPMVAESEPAMEPQPVGEDSAAEQGDGIVEVQLPPAPVTWETAEPEPVEPEESLEDGAVPALSDRAVVKREHAIFPDPLVIMHGEAKLKCVAEVLVDPKGKPGRIGLVDCPAGLHLAALDALGRWRWAEDRGAPETEVVVAEIAFRRLDKNFYPGMTMLADPEAVVVDVNGEVLLRSGKMPDYPDQIRHGDYTCRVSAELDSKGRSDLVLVDNCPGPFRSATLKAVRSWSWYVSGDRSRSILFHLDFQMSDTVRSASTR